MVKVRKMKLKITQKEFNELCEFMNKAGLVDWSGNWSERGAVFWFVGERGKKNEMV